MKRLLLLLFLGLGSTTLYAQDLIIFRNGDELQAKILEISDTEVRYKAWSHQDGPTRTKPTADIFMIKYANGTKETFKEQPKPQPQMYAGTGYQTSPFAPSFQMNRQRDHLLGERENRLSVGVRIRPTMNMMFIDADAMGYRFFGALGGTVDYFLSKQKRYPWFIQGSLEYSLEGGSFEDYNNEKYHLDYINIGVGVGTRSRVFYWDFGYRLGILTNAKEFDFDTESVKYDIYDQTSPVLFSLYASWGFCLTPQIDFGVTYAVSLTNVIKTDAWTHSDYTSTTNFQVGLFFTYRFNIPTKKGAKLANTPQ